MLVVSMTCRLENSIGKVTKALMPFWISTSCSRIAILAHRAHTDRSSGLGGATWVSVAVAMVFCRCNSGRSVIRGDIGRNVVRRDIGIFDSCKRNVVRRGYWGYIDSSKFTL